MPKRNRRSRNLFNREFFEQHTLSVARNLLGARLISQTRSGTCSGIIVEVEAYRDTQDEASHSARGLTARNRPMFGDAGYAYIYLVYGLYHCVNVVTEPKEHGCALLIRALEPETGIDLMQKRRKQSDVRILCSGPGRLCQALGISLRQQGCDLLAKDSPLQLAPAQRIPNSRISVSRRIGITKSIELPWRFYVKDSVYVSKSPRSVHKV